MLRMRLLWQFSFYYWKTDFWRVAMLTHNDNSGYQSRQYWDISVAKLP